MNKLRYEFSEENRRYLLHFLKVANEQKSNNHCNINEYKTFKTLFPLDNKFENDLDDYISKQNTIIDITESDEDSVENVFEQLLQQNLPLDENLEKCEQNLSQSIIDDITYSIKENLETQKCLSSSVLCHLEDSNVNQDAIFSLLSEQLNFEEVLNFGISLKSIPVGSNLLVSYYFRYLLIKKLTLDYSDQLQEVLNEFSVKYSDILLEELTKTLLSTESQSKVFLQFVTGLNTDFKTKMFRKFIFTCENYIGTIEILISSQVEYDSLNRLIEIMSNATNNFNSDKSFGKLLMSVIKFLGKNCALLEQPLKHIIGTHRSIWKAKLQKIFEDCLQDSSVLTQSFRY
ncbi:hypothetical protein NQ314_020556 [Rhamnusium bicolor]|uniref:Uncharacterized protein n=1 Tax=Rhamnusium bicolor TaxID=1586634 RepID=A0AAV8WJP1_9CUCU|nr:hypothetical protein NQ314_020556 [Rhamnusium bicolor]